MWQALVLSCGCRHPRRGRFPPTMLPYSTCHFCHARLRVGFWHKAAKSCPDMEAGWSKVATIYCSSWTRNTAPWLWPLSSTECCRASGLRIRLNILSPVVKRRRVDLAKEKKNSHQILKLSFRISTILARRALFEDKVSSNQGRERETKERGRHEKTDVHGPVTASYHVDNQAFR